MEDHGPSKAKKPVDTTDKTPLWRVERAFKDAFMAAFPGVPLVDYRYGRDRKLFKDLMERIGGEVATVALITAFFDALKNDPVVSRCKRPNVPALIQHAQYLLLRPARPETPTGRVSADAFLDSYEWRRLRMEVIKERGARCECCGATPRDGVRIHADHIKPRKLFPELALVKANIQILCDECNHGKGNWDQTDWRQPF